MTIALDMKGSIRFNAGSFPRLTGKINITQDPINGLLGEINIDESYGLSVKPRGVSSQIIALALEVEDYGILDPTKLHDLKFDRTLDNGSKIEFTLNMDNFSFGTELQWKGPPPGRKKCTLWTGYVIGNSVRWSPYITGAISDHSSRKISATEHRITITLLGPEIENIDQRISYNIQQGHKKSTERIIKEILDAIGEDKVAVPLNGIPKNRAIQLTCEPGLPIAKQLADSQCKVLYWDRDGYVRLVPGGLIDGQPIQQTFNELDVLVSSGDINLESDGGEVPTRVIFSGETIVLDEECGRKIVITRTEVKKKFIPPRGRFRQSGAGVISTNLSAGTLPAEDITESIVIKLIEYECNTIVSERIMKFGYYNPLIARYRIDAAGSFNAYNPGYFLEGSISDISDTSQLYGWQESRLVQTHDELIIYDYADIEKIFYEDIGWEYPPKGVLFRKRKYFSGWYLPEAALKSKASPGTTWEDKDFIANTWILGSGQGVDITGGIFGERYHGFFTSPPGWHLHGEISFQFGFIKYEEEIIHNTQNGYIESEDSRSIQNQVINGDQFLYFGDQTSKLQFESRMTGDISNSFLTVVNHPLLSEIIITSYSAEEKSGLTSVRAYTDLKVKKPVTELTIEDTSDSYLPQSTFKGDNSTENAGQAFEVEASADILLISHPYHEKELTHEYIETIKDAEKYCVYVLREESGIPITFNIPFNIPLDPGHAVRLFLRRGRINHIVFVKEVSGSWQGLGNFLATEVSGKIYVI